VRSCERRWLATVPGLLLVACTAPRTPYAAGSDAGLHGANANVEPPSRGATSIQIANAGIDAQDVPAPKEVFVSRSVRSSLSHFHSSAGARRDPAVRVALAFQSSSARSSL